LKTILKFAVCMLLSVSLEVSTSEAAIAQDNLKTARALVEEFQTLPKQDLFCAEQDWTRDTRSSENSMLLKRMIPKYKHFFSKEFYRLFMWVQCYVPETPPQITRGLYKYNISPEGYYRDFRFGTQADEDNPTDTIRVLPPRSVEADRMTVRVTYAWQLWTDYTLVREDGAWKIDDMAPKAVRTEMETLHWGSKSLKRDLQIVYRLSEEQYRKEQSSKKSADRK